MIFQALLGFSFGAFSGERPPDERRRHVRAGWLHGGA